MTMLASRKSPAILAALVIAGGVAAASLFDASRSWPPDTQVDVDANASEFADRATPSGSVPAAGTTAAVVDQTCTGFATAGHPIGSPATWFTTDDYPAAALREEMQGSSAVRFTVLPTGGVGHCRVQQSSGHSVLDRATCEILSARARYQPRRDLAGCPIPEERTLRIAWVLPPE